jgi:hypothetical protein
MSSQVMENPSVTGGGGEHHRGRPVLGAIAGFLFGVFAAVALLGAGIIPLNSIVVTLLPVLMLVLGIVWGLWAPLGRRAKS